MRNQTLVSYKRYRHGKCETIPTCEKLKAKMITVQFGGKKDRHDSSTTTDLQSTRF